MWKRLVFCTTISVAYYLLTLSMYTLRYIFILICFSGFVDKYHLKCHVLTHSSQKLFPCNLCGAHQKNDSCLRSHMMRVHGLKYMCDVCGKDFSATLGLKIHQREVHQIY